MQSCLSGTRSAVLDGVTGLLVPPGDPDRLAQAIERLLADPEVGAGMGRQGRARIEERYSAAAQTRRLIELFEGADR